MSKGYGAHGKLLNCDEKQVEYVYCSYNVNNPDYEEKDDLNGTMVLDTDIFKTIDVYRRYKGDSSVIERVALGLTPEKLNYQTLYALGMVRIINSHEAWIIDDKGIDQHAIRLVSKIIEEYSRTEKIPQTIGLFY